MLVFRYSSYTHAILSRPPVTLINHKLATATATYLMTDNQDNQDIKTMSTHSRIYIDPMTDEALLYQWDPEHGGWIPDFAAMSAWRTGGMRIYQPTPGAFVTMPGHVRRPAMTDADLCDICATASRPWIPVSAIPTLTESDIARFDSWTYASDAMDHVPTTWDSVTVPLLHYETDIESRFFPSYNQDDAAATALLAIRQEVSVPSAPPLEEWGQNLSVELRGPPVEPTQQLPTQQLPRHVATIVLEQAIATTATCPISMEPIQRLGASVTGCGHVFQTTALRRWMTDRGTCPECRTPTTATAF